MRKADMTHLFIVIVFIIFIAVNINGINDFLSFQDGNKLEFGHSSVAIPEEGWNSTVQMNMTNQSKTSNALTNGYIVIDYWDDWPEDHITSISEDKFKSMEDGGYKVLKTENSTENGIPVSKQYFSNPSRNNYETWNHVGVNYVFPKEDTNYSIQIHYFTTQDYNNTTFIKTLDNDMKNDLESIHNNDYNAFVSSVRGIFNFIVEQIPH